VSLLISSWGLRRRGFLGAGAAALAGAAISGHAAAADSGRILPGLQSITVMEPLAEDLPGTLRAIAGIGYRDIETIGALGLDAPALRRRLDAAGLSSAAQHLCPRAFYPEMLAWSRGEISMTATLAKLTEVYAFDRMDVVLEEGMADAQALGQTCLVWTYLPSDDLTTVAGVDRIAEAFNRAGERCHKAGLTFGFHNGGKGFTPVDGVRPYDMLLRRTDPQIVKMELDVYWMTKAGGDPVAYLDENPGRYPLCHLKDMSREGDIRAPGTGILDFPKILAAAERSGVRAVYVEYDQAPRPLEDSRMAFEFIRRLRY